MNLVLAAVTALALGMTTPNAPSVFWTEDTYVGPEGTVHVEVRESEIFPDENGDCIVVATLEDGPPREFYTQHVQGHKSVTMGKIQFTPNGSEAILVTEAKVMEIAKSVCFD